VESFRVSFWWLFGYVAVISVALGVPLALAIVIGLGFRPPPDVLLVAVLGAIAGADVLAFLALLGVVALYKVQVGADGLRAFTFWGRYRKVPWGDVLSARPVNFLGMRSIRAPTAGPGAPLWIPLFLRDLDGFCALVRRHAGPEHPLARALHQEVA
jgi:hypothetical protein